MPILFRNINGLLINQITNLSSPIEAFFKFEKLNDGRQLNWVLNLEHPLIQ